MSFRLLHTSDWHLGRRLYGRSRVAEQAAFLDWLVAQLDQARIDLLIVSGDIFDSSTPSHRCQALYYGFLHQAARTRCRHIVIVGGNHDSPALLEAPKALLARLNVHVVGQAAEALENEVLTLHHPAGNAEAVVCAVPYLRDRDVRTSSAGESVADKQRRLLSGIEAHYRRVFALARERRKALGNKLPLIATGHLFAAGGKTQAEDGVRELYIGSLVRVEATLFEGVDYLALGHLHSPQRVAGAEHLRYSGAPLAVSFAEARQAKCVLTCEWSEMDRMIDELAVPSFQPLERIQGDLPEVQAVIEARVAAGRSLWVEVVYTGQEIRSDLVDTLQSLAADSPVEILRIRNRRRSAQLLRRAEMADDLEHLTPGEVFARCLDAHSVEAQERPALNAMFEKVLQDIRENSVD
ncbi:MAG: exonuclease SbcCD subunit D C-terminal domain-containing protein [Desulfosarcinaceae bacterium]